MKASLITSPESVELKTFYKLWNNHINEAFSEWYFINRDVLCQFSGDSLNQINRRRFSDKLLLNVIHRNFVFNVVMVREE